MKDISKYTLLCIDMEQYVNPYVFKALSFTLIETFFPFSFLSLYFFLTQDLTMLPRLTLNLQSSISLLSRWDYSSVFFIGWFFHYVLIKYMLSKEF